MTMGQESELPPLQPTNEHLGPRKASRSVVRLPQGSDGDMAMAYRRMISPPLGDAQLEEQMIPS